MNGTEPIAFQWFEEDRSSNESMSIEGATADSFTTPAMLEDKNYWVRVSNAAGSIESRTARIEVITRLFWSAADSGTEEDLVRVDYESRGTGVFAHASDGTVLQPVSFDRLQWEPANADTPIGPDLRSETEGVSVGEEGLIRSTCQEDDGRAGNFDLNAVVKGKPPTGWVAVGDGGTILYSADACLWEFVEVPPKVDFHEVIQGQKGFVLIGDRGTLLLSDDGRSWVEGGPTTDVDLLGVEHRGFYIAVGRNGSIFVAPDAKSIWPDKFDRPDDFWLSNRSFGDYNVRFKPWIYHKFHGWMYVFPKSTFQRMFLWDFKMRDWLYTTESIYPHLWDFGRKGWIVYEVGSRDPRVFVDARTGERIEIN